MSEWSYPKHCCSIREWNGLRLGYGACADQRDPDVCKDCDDAKKRYQNRKRKRRETSETETGER